MENSKQEKLLIVWTSADREVALNMILMYAANADSWWDSVSLLLWGPSQKLFLEDTEIQDAIKQIKERNVRLLACVSCANKYGIADELKTHDLEVFSMGPLLSNWLQSNSKVITF